MNKKASLITRLRTTNSTNQKLKKRRPKNSTSYPPRKTSHLRAKALSKASKGCSARNSTSRTVSTQTKDKLERSNPYQNQMRNSVSATKLSLRDKKKLNSLLISS